MPAFPKPEPESGPSEIRASGGRGSSNEKSGDAYDVMKVTHRKAKESEMSGPSVNKSAVSEPKVVDHVINESDIRRIEN
jgi:hypothetical protein